MVEEILLVRLETSVRVLVATSVDVIGFLIHGQG